MIHPPSAGMTSMQQNFAQIEKSSFPEGSLPTVYPFHPTQITKILHQPPQDCFHVKQRLDFQSSHNPLAIISPTEDPSLPFKQPKLVSTSSIRTVESNFKSRFLRYYGKYPSLPDLVKRPFGRPSRNHSFTSEVVFDHILIFLIKSSFLDHATLHSLLRVHPLYLHLSRSLSRLKFLDFRPLSRFNKNFDSQKSIPYSRRMQFLAFILHYNFNSS